MLYIIRHGKTDWNAALKLQGRTDIPLNAEGIRMAEAAHDAVSKIDFDICYSSPLIRAYDTAKILLANTSTPIIKDQRLIELGFGKYEGINNTYSNPEYPISILFNNPEAYIATEDAESLDMLFERTKNFLDEEIFPKLELNKNILIVGHGAMNCALISNIKGYERKDFWKDMTGNCELVRLL